MRMAECHPDKKYYALGMCRSCYERNLRKRNPDYAERQRKNCHSWNKLNKAYKQQRDKEYMKNRMNEDSGYNWKRNIKWKFNMTSDDYHQMLADQNGGCAICGAPENGRRLHIDHCHKTGKVRGLLCFKCNVGISHFSEDIELFKKAIKYLESIDERR